KLRFKLDSNIQNKLIANETDFYLMLESLTNCITEVIEEIIPKSCPSLFMKRWQSKKIADKRLQTRQLGQNSYSRHSNLDDPIHKEYKCCQNKYGLLIERTKKQHWETFLDMVDEHNVWMAHRYISRPPSD
ncbi:hypothetical protein K439DRAFT_1261534, partial [Ramaria rubella]